MTIGECPLISIITVNYNNHAVTAELLRSLYSLEYTNFEVIVVDNASLIDPTEELIKIYPNATIIRSDKNLGFAGGNNLGIKSAKGELLFFINNDTELTPGILQPLIDTFHKHPDAGAVSPKFHYYFHPGIIEYAGYQRVSILTGRNGMIGCKEKDIGQYDKETETHYTHGGAMMLPRYIIDLVGLMPESYFLYYEEFDWCEQIKRKGFKIYYQPRALIYHKESMTTGKESTLKTYYITRNRILFMRRNAKPLHLIMFILYLSVFTIPKNIFTFLLKRKFDHIRAFRQGLMWNLKHLSLQRI